MGALQIIPILLERVQAACKGCILVASLYSVDHPSSIESLYLRERQSVQVTCCAEMVDEGVKYNDCQTLASRDGLNTKARVNQIPYTASAERHSLPL